MIGLSHLIHGNDGIDFSGLLRKTILEYECDKYECKVEFQEFYLFDLNVIKFD